MSINKNEVPCRLRLADMQIEKGLFKTALEHCYIAAGLKFSKEMITKGMYRAGICYFNLENYPLAMNCIEDAEELAPNNKAIFDMRMKIKAAIKLANEKIEDCTRLLRIEKANIKVLLARAQYSMAVGQIHNLKSSFRDLVHVLNLGSTSDKACQMIIEIKKRIKDSGLTAPDIEAYEIPKFESSSSEEYDDISDENESNEENISTEGNIF